VLDVPRTNRATIGDRAFNVSADRAWNSLTTAVQSSESLGTFRRRLKAELFMRSYSWHCLSNDWTAAWLIFTFQTAFAACCCCNLEVDLLTIMLLWRSLIIIIIIIIIISNVSSSFFTVQLPQPYGPY